MSFMPPHWQVGSLKLVSPGTTRIDKTKYEGPLEYVFKNKHFVFSGYVMLGHMMILFLSFCGTGVLFSIVAAPVYTFSTSA